MHGTAARNLDLRSMIEETGQRNIEDELEMDRNEKGFAGNPTKSESILEFLVQNLIYATVCCVFCFCTFFFGFQHLRWGAWGEVGMAANLDDASQRPWRFYALRCEVAKIECVGIVGIVGMADVCKGLYKILQRSLHFLRLEVWICLELQPEAHGYEPDATLYQRLGLGNLQCMLHLTFENMVTSNE